MAPRLLPAPGLRGEEEEEEEEIPTGKAVAAGLPAIGAQEVREQMSGL